MPTVSNTKYPINPYSSPSYHSPGSALSITINVQQPRIHPVHHPFLHRPRNPSRSSRHLSPQISSPATAGVIRDAASPHRADSPTPSAAAPQSRPEPSATQGAPPPPPKMSDPSLFQKTVKCKVRVVSRLFCGWFLLVRPFVPGGGLKIGRWGFWRRPRRFSGGNSDWSGRIECKEGNAGAMTDLLNRWQVARRGGFGGERLCSGSFWKNMRWLSFWIVLWFRRLMWQF